MSDPLRHILILHFFKHFKSINLKIFAQIRTFIYANRQLPGSQAAHRLWLGCSARASKFCAHPQFGNTQFVKISGYLVASGYGAQRPKLSRYHGTAKRCAAAVLTASPGRVDARFTVCSSRTCQQSSHFVGAAPPNKSHLLQICKTKDRLINSSGLCSFQSNFEPAHVLPSARPSFFGFITVCIPDAK